jgi:hypothetical protein
MDKWINFSTSEFNALKSNNNTTINQALILLQNAPCGTEIKNHDIFEYYTQLKYQGIKVPRSWIQTDFD